MAVPVLVDPSGSPVSSYSLGLGSARLMQAAQNDGERPAWPLTLDSINRVVPTWDWRTIVSVSRRLYANMGVPRGAIDQKAKFSFGRAWMPKFQGLDKAWGKIAEEWLREEWYGLCNVRGSMYDFVTDLHLGSIAVDRDGDFGILLTESDDGYPQLQYIPAHRIGQRQASWTATIVGENDAWSYMPRGDDTGKRRKKKGAYAGLVIENGVIYNEIGRPVAYRILGRTLDEDTDVSARDFIHVFDPEWMDQGRGFPAFAHACNELRDTLVAHQREQIAQLITSSLGIQEYNDSGAADTGDMAQTVNADTGEITISRHQVIGGGGRMDFFRANSGGKIESFASQRPSAMWDQFQDRLIRSALAGINWSYALAWKPSDANAANLRGELLKCKATVEDRQALMAPPARRMAGYGVSKAIQLGLLPEYTGTDRGGFLKWGFTMPPDMSVDKGRDGQNRRANYLLGAQNQREICAEDGEEWVAHRDQRQLEVTDIIKRAQAVSTETGVPFTTALSLLEQRTANPVVEPPLDEQVETQAALADPAAQPADEQL